ncbi:lysine transporter LysE [Ignicoccus pacificus DSM 13166]|uniref:Lysine transporter LysE n=1 Tax=Ignicoccus pacificus DSM 13166 TaxID=940294 RepID=A0A977KAL2_9CREN|nr:lysine transporter LysE [Ignicoccus pacificus DSM 13166]
MKGIIEEHKDLVMKTLLITPSGALSPGLLSASAVAAGASLGVLGGLLVALGHTLFELPYVFVLSTMMGRIKRIAEKYGKVLNAIVIAFALFFAWGLIEGGGSASVSVSDALAAGFIFTASNAYFLLWWATVGFPLVEEIAGSPRRFAVMYTSHVWMDYVWLALLAAVGGASRLLGPYYSLFNYALAAMLVIFALDIALRTYLNKKLLPY